MNIAPLVNNNEPGIKKLVSQYIFCFPSDFE